MDNHASLIASMMTKGGVCANCVAATLAVPRWRTPDVLGGIAKEQARKITIAVAPCDGCQKETVVHRLG